MNNITSKDSWEVGFSLVEVVIALGIFSVAIVAMLSVFGGTHRNTRSLMDLDSMVAVRQAVDAAISSLPATTIHGTPAGLVDSAARPELFVWFLPENSTGYTITNTVDATTAAATTSTGDGRIYRARLYRGLTGASGSEATWIANRAAYPIRVNLDVFAAGGYSSTAKPVESSTFNAVWNAR